MSEYILEMRDITKTFARNTVLDKVELLLKPGEVHALMGENGAGKSTLMKILMGIYHRDGGTILLDGEQVEFKNAKQALEHGIAMIHQELNPVLDMQIYENVFLGKEKCLGNVKGMKLVDKKAMQKETLKYLKEVGMEVSPLTVMRDLSTAQTQLVEIAKAISWDAKIIIMDEPTSAITDKEVDVLFELIRKLKEQGKSVIYISHKMEEIFKICDTVTVLRDGKYIGRNSTSEISEDKMISMMVGREIKDVYPKREVPIGDVVLEAKNISQGDVVKNISFQLHAGEILGISGLIGAGRSELVETIFGLRKMSSGEVYLRGQKVDLKNPAVSIKNKIAFVSEDRKVTGLNLISSVRDNICTVSLKQLLSHGITNKKNENDAADKYIDMLKIKTDSREKTVGDLSGGNQQKVAIAKWLLGDPDIIILDEPTRGIDVGAKRDIYLLMEDLVEAGKAIIMISSEMPEVMGMSDRILVLSEGILTGEVPRAEFDQEQIMAMSFANVKQE